MPRWSWDFEDERPAAGTEAAGPPSPTKADERPGATPTPNGGERPGAKPGGAPSGPTRRNVSIRRRRTLAAVGLLALLAVIVAAASAGSGHKKAHPKPTETIHAVRRAPTDPEQEEAAGVRSVLAYTPFVKEGAGTKKEIALTFDDGPGPFTPQVLSVLEHHRVRATFFVIGRMLRYFGASTVREIEDGDVIGDHTENHPMLAHLSAHDQYEELFEQIARVELLGGRRPTLFRPPYGSFNATTFRELKRLHLLMVLWSVDTDDYEQPGVPTIVQRALEGAQPGAIILLHDAGGQRQQTIEALPQIIKGFRDRGYKLVTVPRLLADDPPPQGEPIPPNLSGD
jgi:peptidoglycan/xylan/chitin deacetylase (PgdA/CDA1 family)